MGPNRGLLSRQLDRDVQAAVYKYLEKTETNPLEASTDEIFTYIKRSNSNLARRSKVLLEDCIERILEVMKAEENSDSDERLELASQPITDSQSQSNTALNRSLTAGWNLSKVQDTETPPRPSLMSRESNHNASETTAPSPAMTGVKRSVKRIKPNPSASGPKMPVEPRMKLENILGMESQIERLIKLLLLPFDQPELYRGKTVTRGILLHGPPGCGKTMLCEAVAHAFEVPLISISAPSVVSGMSGESEATIREHFAKAVQVAPSIIFIDEIDAITPKRESTQRGMEQRIVSQLLTSMDGLAPEKIDNKTVMVLAATNRPDSLDSALRRTGRFDAEIEMTVPDTEGRLRILEGMTTKVLKCPDVDLHRIARLTPGFVAADLEGLVREAEGQKLNRFLEAWEAVSLRKAADSREDHAGDVAMRDPDVDMTNSGDITVASAQCFSPAGRKLVAMRSLFKSDPELAASLRAQNEETTMADFLYAVTQIQASTTREGFTTVPNVPWSDVGAYHEIRAMLQEAVVSPILEPEVWRLMGQGPPGVLLYGPPGCGKTLLAKAVASASQANFISVKGPELLNKYVGESEKAVRQLFQRARYSQPVIVFFDELDAMVPRRDDSRNDASNRVVNAILAELDGVSKKEEVYVIGATNRRDAIDPAILRPGRLGESIYVGLPGESEREDILATLIRPKPVREADRAKICALARGCDKFSGADLARLVYKASAAAIRRYKEGPQSVDVGPGRGPGGSTGVVDRAATGLVNRGTTGAVDKGPLELRIQDFEVALKEVEPSVEDAEFMAR